MIQKLFNLKKIQIEQHFLRRQQCIAKIDTLRTMIVNLEFEINTRGVELFGAIRDFQMLEIHKQNLKNEMKRISFQIKELDQEIQKQNEMIRVLMQEQEQFKYILDLKKDEKIKKYLKDFEDQSSELIQYRHVHG